jgi:uncharacterized protein involved in type VI secretion and phage assembly
MPSTFGYMLVAVALTAATFVGLWWLLAAGGDESLLLPALAASLVLLLALGGREVVMRRAWARYTRELELRMGAGEPPLKLLAVAPGGGHKLKVRTTGASFRALQQRLARADELGAQQPEAHREAYRLCEQYLADSEEAIRAPGVAPDVRAALRAGQERVRELQKNHLLAWARGETQRLTQEAQRRASPSARIETAMQALDVIGEALQVYPGEPALQASALAVRNFVASVKVAHWVELAERAAFRGRYSRAIARYRDALFYLARAEMSDDARGEAAGRINREIELLRARVALDEDGTPPRRPEPPDDES